uniref:SBP-type domain-containing protein n=1 Tax=Zea mays TaxID=4577 RepID=C0PCE6_MAIZE|nr:unknown [Zea mays]|eukprot:NP_001266758.1 uncharacterized LOC101027207 [Zea mays]
MKRPRLRPGGAGGAQCPSCAVDGCKADLSKCRDYHRRHKVCETHSKTPIVVVTGREMRFCQQCSRHPNLSSAHNKAGAVQERWLCRRLFVEGHGIMAWEEEEEDATIN